MDSQTLLATEKDLKQKLKSINQQIEECFEKVNTLFSEQDKQELKSNLSKVEESIKSTIEKLKQLNQEISDISKKKETLTEKRESLQQQLQKTQTDIQNHEENKKKESALLENSKNKLKELNQKLAELKKKLPYTSILDYERNIHQLQEQLNNPKISKQAETEYQKKIQALKQGKEQYIAYYELWEECVNEQQTQKNLEEKYKTRLTDLEVLKKQEAQIQKALKELESTSDEEDENPLEPLIEKRNELRKELKKLKEEKEQIRLSYLQQHKGKFEKRDEIRKEIEILKKKKQEIGSSLSEISNQIVTFKIDFKSGQLGPILGKGGKNIKAIEESTKAEIRIPKYLNMITIRGNQESVDLARSKIYNLLNTRQEASTTIRFKPSMTQIIFDDLDWLKRRTKTKLFVDKVEGIIKITGNKEKVEHAQEFIQKYLNDYAPLNQEMKIKSEMKEVISKRLNLIKRKSEVKRIEFKNADTLELDGNSKTINKAKEVIKQLIEKYSQAKGEFKFQQDQLGAIIGRQGSNIRRIERDSDAILSIDKKKQVVTIFGSKEGVEKAKKLLAEVAPSSIQMNIKDGQASKLIGTRGETIRKLEKESNCSIFVERKKNIVIITGKEEDIEYAKNMIQNVLKEN